jgi:small subunit ribosomal protein S8
VAGLERFTASLESVAFVSGSWLIKATFRVFVRPVGRNENHMMTDPIADMLTRIRNAVRVEHPTVDVPFSKVKRGLADVLKKEGFIWDWREVESTPAPVLQLELKYGPNGERLIQHIKRISTPGRRVYSRSARLRPILNGLGITILSTSSGVVSDREARQRKLGGEVLCELW